MSVLLTVDQASGLFSGVLLNGIDNPDVVIHSWADVGVALNKLDETGELAATLKTADGKTHLSQSEDRVFAIGSTFKLYVLGALQTSIAAGLHQWSEKRAIHDEWKSLPSGTMQNLPVGQQVALLDFATNMISISDNTAADHLLNFLGRDNVQLMLQPMGNSHWSLNEPFMSTLEMFKLKWAINPTDTAGYIAADPVTRLQILNRLAQIDRKAVGTNGIPLDLPTDISKLEWFGTTDDTCNAILSLANMNSPEVRQVLSKNTPLLNGVGQAGSHWAYAGFKGGSEPGVLSMTYLLESKNGNRACLSMSWNNTTKPVSQNFFIDVVKKTLTFAETQVP